MNDNQNNKMIYGLGGVIIGVILVWIFAPITQFGGYGGMMSWRNNRFLDQQENRGVQMVGNIDRHFIEQMIPHHEGAISMAELALRRSKRTEIKTLAEAIIKAQTKETKDMSEWYENWFGVEVPEGSVGMMNGGMMSQRGMHMGGTEDMATLEKAVDFDKAFIEAMIPHHQLALMMARMLEVGSNRAEMLQLAENINSSQSQEIEQMQGWYREWYK
jgi:uncharacterized protein (DUF305 family)